MIKLSFTRFVLSFRRLNPDLLSFWLGLFLSATVQAAQAKPAEALSSLNPADYAWIGERLYQNECAGQPRYLTHWGKGEAFPSFGIAHFIWFPKGVEAPFEETFPALFAFLRESSTPPEWLTSYWLQSIQKQIPFDAPWENKNQFDQAGSSDEMVTLREWLANTRSQQAAFVVQSFRIRWQHTVQTKPDADKQQLIQKMSRLMRFKAGTFSAIDYFNFKGIGGNSKEQYQGVGWGLIEVLQHIPNTLFNQPDNTLLLRGFIESAKQRLQTRVNLAPVDRNESRWLAGWFKRLDGYLDD